MQLTLGEARLDLSSPVVMAIINVTPDSFYPNSRTPDEESLHIRIANAVAQGAAILDVGGYSSRPGAEEVPPEEEFRRLDRALAIIRRDAPQAAVSLDTFRRDVAAEIILRHGPCILNDITGGNADPGLATLAATHGLPYIAMHMRGTPATMAEMTAYEEVVEEVCRTLIQKRDRLYAAGVSQVILDPGFGFAKTLSQNYALLAGLHRLGETGCPVLAGISRKSMIYKTLGITPEDALPGTCALHWECLRQGASILRVHDVREALQVIRLYEQFRRNRQESV